ncbi:MAG: hexose kinase [Arcanobacterium sp.]|nr:hexose kinase [Arcanobacterium sp.]MDY5588377.1 hexose kinase [Arcanobacterium sp.]
MIVTITPNPALDLTYHVPTLTPGAEHRVQHMYIRPGGKGINTAKVLTQLGEQALATGFVGGANGEVMVNLLDEDHVPHALVHAAMSTRLTVSIIDPSNGATLFNEPGKERSEQEWEKLIELVTQIDTPDLFTVNGSFPPGTSEATVRHLYRALLATGATVLVDTSHEPLRWAVEEGVHAIKPNQHELADLVGSDDVDVRASIAHLLEHVQLVVASQGANGMVAQARGGEVVAVPAARFVVGNPTGAGDSVVASLARSITRDGIESAHQPATLRAWVSDAIALSAATVAAPVAGEFDEATYRDLLAQS